MEDDGFDVNEFENEFKRKINKDSAVEFAEFLGIFYQKLKEKRIPEEFAKQLVSTLMIGILNDSINND